jgi:NADH:ubiquinone oxidoreductase subunit 6 (subunit J)
VYILTFVSAVVMLFLSVVLMLPSSAISVPKKSLPLFAVLPELLDTVLLTLCLVLLSVLGSYLVYA